MMSGGKTLCFSIDNDLVRPRHRLSSHQHAASAHTRGMGTLRSCTSRSLRTSARSIWGSRIAIVLSCVSCWRCVRRDSQSSGCSHHPRTHPSTQITNHGRAPHRGSSRQLTTRIFHGPHTKGGARRACASCVDVPDDPVVHAASLSPLNWFGCGRSSGRRKQNNLRTNARRWCTAPRTTPSVRPTPQRWFAPPHPPSHLTPPLPWASPITLAHPGGGHPTSCSVR
jgi:hypothetical protein